MLLTDIPLYPIPSDDPTSNMFTNVPWLIPTIVAGDPIDEEAVAKAIQEGVTAAFSGDYATAAENVVILFDNIKHYLQTLPNWLGDIACGMSSTCSKCRGKAERFNDETITVYIANYLLWKETQEGPNPLKNQGLLDWLYNNCLSEMLGASERCDHWWIEKGTYANMLIVHGMVLESFGIESQYQIPAGAANQTGVLSISEAKARARGETPTVPGTSNLGDTIASLLPIAIGYKLIFG